ncbi:MAG TPA: hypothetical protein VJN65_02780 [Bacteroidota bacterium]|nr:hypothetical protein [Bacteroidota bacterium]
MKSFFLFIVLSSCILLSCDGGLTLPPEVEPGLSGSLTVQGPWPPQDSVKTLWIFASQIFPLDSSKIASGILANKILLYPSIAESLPYNFTSLSFNFALPPATYYYVGVLQRFGDNLLDPNSYRVVGVNSDPGSPGIPRTVTVQEFEVVTGMNVTIDFYNLPPQPF